MWLFKSLLLILGVMIFVMFWRHKTQLHEIMRQIATLLCLIVGVVALMVVYKRYF